MNVNNICECLRSLLFLQIEVLNLLILKKKIDIENRKKKKRLLVRPINKKRSSVGYFITMFQELKQDADMFFKVTRMNLESFNYLNEFLSPYLLRPKSNICPEERLAITIRFLASGDSILSIALDYRIGRSTCYNIILDTCTIIYERLSPVYLSIPTEDEWKQISEGFWNEWQMPNCIGSIDGKHIYIKSPPNSNAVYYNYKKSFSLVLLAVCNYKYEFKLFDVGAVGSESDGGVLTRSELGKALSEKKLNIPLESNCLPGTNTYTPFYFVGDEAFQLSSNMMRPFPGRNLDDKKLIFNYRLSRARRLIENAFGILVSRWQFLTKALGMYPDAVIKVVVASICLHNFLMKYSNESRNIYCPTSYVDREDGCRVIQSGDWQHNLQTNCLEDIHNIDVHAEVVNGSSIRDMLADYFLTSKGEASWQYEFIRRGSYRDN